jgi:hypothetical protein
MVAWLLPAARSRSVVVLLLLLLLLLELWVVAPELWRSVRLSRVWHVNHAVLWGSTSRATSGGSCYSPLPLLLLGHFTSPHSALLISGCKG